MLYALLIADIGENILKYAYFAVVSDGELKPRLRHERKKPRCFQRNGLASRIRSRYHEAIEILTDGNAYRHAGVFIQQRMTRIFKADKALFAYLRHHARIAERKLTLGKNECQSRYAVMISAEHRGVFGDIGGKLKEITLRFVRLCAFEYAYLVICLHHADRLYKERRAR